jgi:hypothetical protein
MRHEQRIRTHLQFAPEPLLLVGASERLRSKSYRAKGNAAMNGTVGETA